MHQNKTKMTQLRLPSRWMSLEIILAKRRRRYLERVWRRTRSPLDISRYNKQLHLCNRMMSISKSDYYTRLLSNPRQMWNSVNKYFTARNPHCLITLLWIHCAAFFLSSSLTRSPSSALILSQIITVTTFLNHRV